MQGDKGLMYIKMLGMGDLLGRQGVKPSANTQRGDPYTIMLKF